MMPQLFVQKFRKLRLTCEFACASEGCRPLFPVVLAPAACVQAVCVQLNDSVTFRMHWPTASEMRVNGIQ